jgi:hypothetical protein
VIVVALEAAAITRDTPEFMSAHTVVRHKRKIAEGIEKTRLDAVGG